MNGQIRSTIILIIVALAVVAAVFIYEKNKTPSDVGSTLELNDVQKKALKDLQNVLENRNKALGLTIDKVVGIYFTNPFLQGKTLYTTEEECLGACLETWAPYLAETSLAEEGYLSVVRRSDSGKFQYAWKGQSLYTFSGDSRSGDVLGDGFDHVWHIARP